MTAKGPQLQPSTGKGDPLVGRNLGGRYRLLSVLARGGMGKVYRAEQEPLGRIVAVKVLDVDGQDQADFAQRFFREAEVCSKLTHPNTVRVFDYGQTDDDVYYIVMEFLRGVTLKAVMKGQGPMPAQRLVPIVRQICGSLAEAHGNGVIHRDLKPSNILLTRHGEERDVVKVLDFGLVKQIKDADQEVTRTGYILGSPMYMSPEQVRGQRVGPASDQYALGVIMYRALTGKPPFVRDSALSLLMSHVRHAPPPMAAANPAIAVNPAVESVVMACLAKEPEGRFASMAELARALRACESDLAGHVPGGLGPLKISEGRALLPDSLDTLLTRFPPPTAKAAYMPPEPRENSGATRSTVPVWSVFLGIGMLFLAAVVVVGGTVLGAWFYGSRASIAERGTETFIAPATPPREEPDPANSAKRTAEVPPAGDGTSEEVESKPGVDTPQEATEPKAAWAPEPIPSQDRPRTAPPPPPERAGSKSTAETPDAAEAPEPSVEDDWARPSDIRDPWGD